MNENRVDDTYVLLQIDGPPMAYFEIPNDDSPYENGEMPVLCIKYYRVEIFGPVEVLGAETAEAKFLDEVRRAMRHTCARQGIIWWRQRFEAEIHGGHWRIRGRLGTSPKLPEAFWQRYDRVDPRTCRHDWVVMSAESQIYICSLCGVQMPKLEIPL